MLARWFEFLGGHPETAEGLPATSAHLKQFLIGSAAIGVGVWVVANVLGNYVLA